MVCVVCTARESIKKILVSEKDIMSRRVNTEEHSRGGFLQLGGKQRGEKLSFRSPFKIMSVFGLASKVSVLTTEIKYNTMGFV